MKNTLDHKHAYRKTMMDMKHEFDINHFKLRENERKLMESMDNYYEYEQEMHQKAEEELYEKQQVLRSMNYKMKKMGGDKSMDELQRLQREDEMMRNRLFREKLQHDFIGKMNDIDRMLLMIDAGILNDIEQLKEIDNNAKIKSKVNKMNKDLVKEQERESRQRNTKDKYDKKWVDNIMKLVQNEKYEHSEVENSKSPRMKLKNGYKERRRSSIFKPVKSNRFW